MVLLFNFMTTARAQPDISRDFLEWGVLNVLSKGYQAMDVIGIIASIA